MDNVYRLTIYDWPNGDDREGSDIGMFATREEAERVAREYLETVPGFKDYYCEAEITELPIIGWNGSTREVHTVIGWNEDPEGNEIDLLEIGCYASAEQAGAAFRQALQTHFRNHWSEDCWTIGEKHCREGFVREYPSGRQALTLREVRDALTQRRMVNLTFHYAEEAHNYFPLDLGKDLFLATEEFDFLPDGFTIRRLRDVDGLDHPTDFYARIMAAEGWPERLTVPEVELSSWQTVFTSLQKLGRNIIVEQEYLDEAHFTIGAIQAVQSDHVLLLPFGADGVWEESPWEIPYRDITSVSFDTRYINVFSKYLPPKP